MACVVHIDSALWNCGKVCSKAGFTGVKIDMVVHVEMAQVALQCQQHTQSL